MHNVSRPATGLPLHGPAASRAIEQAAQATLAPHTLMRRAGLGVARLALALAPHARNVWIAAGPGNNGGDGFEAALHLHGAGKAVRVSFAGDATRLPADAADALARARAAGVAIGNDDPPPLGAQDLAVDALLGLGASRAPEGRIAERIAQFNTLGCTRLAVDLPSGLDATTGQPLGTACVHATHTLALLTLKPGLYTGQGRDFAGEVWFDDLGVDASDAPVDAWLSGTDAVAAALPPRAHAGHKGSFGDVAVVGGAPGMTGAALLAARAAHAAGAGRVFVCLLDPDRAGPAAMALDPVRPELMFRRAWWDGPPAQVGAATVVAGCGGDDAIRAALPRLLAVAPRLVLDADALNAIAADPGVQAQLAARAGRGLATVLTPHPLEAARLLGAATDARAVQADRVRSAATLADRFACVVVLKGSGTVIAPPGGGAPHVNPTGNAALATAGTGDVLAGWIGGLWAQQQGGRADRALDCAVAAVYLHGAAADAARTVPFRAGELVEAMVAGATRHGESTQGH